MFVGAKWTIQDSKLFFIWCIGSRPQPTFRGGFVDLAPNDCQTVMGSVPLPDPGVCAKVKYTILSRPLFCQCFSFVILFFCLRTQSSPDTASFAQGTRSNIADQPRLKLVR